MCLIAIWVLAVGREKYAFRELVFSVRLPETHQRMAYSIMDLK